MSAFDGNDRSITIPRTQEEQKKWGWDPHETVTLRVVPTAADEEWVNNQVLKLTSNTGKGKRKGRTPDLQSQLGSANRLWVERMVKSWTFTKGGLAMPLTSQSIKELQTSYVERIYQALNDEQPEEDEEEDEDFTSDASPITEEEREVVEETPSRNYLSR